MPGARPILPTPAMRESAGAMHCEGIKDINYRGVAVEIRAMAAASKSEVISLHLLRIAADYEVLAATIALIMQQIHVAGSEPQLAGPQ
jgi:hypothetical protein